MDTNRLVAYSVWRIDRLRRVFFHPELLRNRSRNSHRFLRDHFGNRIGEQQIQERRNHEFSVQDRFHTGY